MMSFIIQQAYLYCFMSVSLRNDTEILINGAVELGINAFFIVDF